MGNQIAISVVVCLLLALYSLAGASKRTFTLEDDRFVKDGKPTQIFSGSFHYQRIHPAYWEDRLLRVKAMGLNALQTYVPWNVHEPTPGVYNWEGFADLERFLELASSLDLLVLLRPGPYICAEWEFGGFPWWLASSMIEGGGDMKMRVSDPRYLAHVNRWFNELLPRVAPYLYERGGPIVMVQVENEYGFCGPKFADKAYLRHLVKTVRASLGKEVLIYTTDPPWSIPLGTLPGDEVFSVVDFGPGIDVNYAFSTQKAMNKPGHSPPLCSEFYTGWITHWGELMANTSAEAMMKTLTDIVSYANNTGSVNLYMAHGGTNFGYWAGANVAAAPPAVRGGGEIYQPTMTSYDYNCPVSESGRTGQPGVGGLNKFELIRDLFTTHSGRKSIDFPEPLPLEDFGTVSLSESVALLDALTELFPGDGIPAHKPDIMENYDQMGGVIVYRTTVPGKALANGDAVLDIGAPVHDFAKVLVDGEVQGDLERNNPRNLTLQPPAVRRDARDVTLEIVVHAMGRVNFGCIWDFKGLVHPDIKLNGEHHSLQHHVTKPLPHLTSAVQSLTVKVSC